MAKIMKITWMSAAMRTETAMKIKTNVAMRTETAMKIKMNKIMMTMKSLKRMGMLYYLLNKVVK